MSSTFGHVFRISTWGESHGGGVGVVIDGCPPLIELTEADVQVDLDRRRPGQSEIVTPRDEADTCQILSGVFQGRTLGTPIAINFQVRKTRSGSSIMDCSSSPPRKTRSCSAAGFPPGN